MNQTAGDAWHYTHEGERIGPVSLADLRIKAREGMLHPRMDMVWTQGMAEWRPAGEIDDLFERKTVEAVQEPVPARANPYMPPAQVDVAETPAAQVRWPGARRRSFYLMIIGFPLVWNFLFAAAATMFGQNLSPEILQIAGGVVVLVPCILVLYISLQRLANVGMSRWWFLGNLVPILNLWVGYRMYVCPAGYAHHKKLDTAGVILAILYWLMIVLTLLFFLAMIAVFFGMAGNPEIQQQFNDAIQEALKQQPAGS